MTSNLQFKRGGVGSMTDLEVVEFIKKSRVGILCFVDADRPYAVPMEHIYRDNSIYWGIGGFQENPAVSRKLDCLRRNARACYVIYESMSERPNMVAEKKRCRSLILEGTVTLDDVEDTPQKAKIQVLQMHIETIGNWTCPSQGCPVLLRGEAWHMKGKQSFIDAYVTKNQKATKKYVDRHVTKFLSDANTRAR